RNTAQRTGKVTFEVENHRAGSNYIILEKDEADVREAFAAQSEMVKMTIRRLLIIKKNCEFMDMHTLPEK
ncbi:hypothetical protein, partial [Kozakia baliensis]|uniref:hypothetical protein n=1 Tax=Kozakia baliensis TaxID=153496 RepID=UPI001C98E8C4